MTCRSKIARLAHSHHLSRTQMSDRIGVIAERAQHLVGMRAELGRHPIEPPATMGELKPAAGEAQAPIRRVDLLKSLPRHDLRMTDHFLDIPDAGAWRAGGLQNPCPFARTLFRQRLLDNGAERLLILLPREPVGETRIFERVFAA